MRGQQGDYCGYCPVSYTHLDVYKRQGKEEAGKDGLKAQLEQAIKEENYEKAAEIRDLMKKKKEKSDETA